MRARRVKVCVDQRVGFDFGVSVFDCNSMFNFLNSSLWCRSGVRFWIQLLVPLKFAIWVSLFSWGLDVWFVFLVLILVHWFELDIEATHTFKLHGVRSCVKSLNSDVRCVLVEYVDICYTSSTALRMSGSPAGGLIWFWILLAWRGWGSAGERPSWFRVWHLTFRVQGLGFRV